jgi:phosphatidylserine decarboxylase
MEKHLAYHPEGKKSLINITVNLLIFNGILFFAINEYIFIAFSIISFFYFIWILYSFRNPERKVVANDNYVYAPADGKIIAIKEVTENEVLNEKRIQISIAMSWLDVHATRFPIGGQVVYIKQQSGKSLTWYPKNTSDKDITTIVIENNQGIRVLIRHIAGVFVDRIICFANENSNVNQGQEMGFIKYGSQVDILLPVNAKLNARVGTSVKANYSVIAKL